MKDLTRRAARFDLEALWGYIFIAPFCLVAGVFLFFPIAYSLYISLRETGVFSSWSNFGDMHWVGLGNYTALVTSPSFWYSIFATTIYAIIFIPLLIAASLGLALALSSGRLPGYNALRSAFFLPHVFDVFVVGVIWLLLFNTTSGPFVALTDALGLPWFRVHGFLDNPITLLPSVAFAMVLKGMGFGMVLFIVALHNIPQSLFEAADIDGASPFQKLRLVTLPLLRPMMLFMVVTSLMGVLNGFTEFYAMTKATGGPAVSFFGETVQSGRVSGLYLYRLFDEFFYGRAAAMSFILLAIALVVTAINFRLLGDRTQ